MVRKKEAACCCQDCLLAHCKYVQRCHQGLLVQDEGCVCSFPHQLRHLRGRLFDRGQEFPWREVHQESEDAPRRDSRELQGTEGRADCPGKLHRGCVPICCTYPAVHHCE